jgi:hypothetical protein
MKRIEELEQQVEWLKKKTLLTGEITAYLKTLAEMPEDAVLLYKLTDQTIQHSIGRSARVLLEKVSAD